MYIDRLYETLKEVYELSIDCLDPDTYKPIEDILKEYEDNYGKNATSRLKVIVEERKKHAKELNGKDTD